MAVAPKLASIPMDINKIENGTTFKALLRLKSNGMVNLKELPKRF